MRTTLHSPTPGSGAIGNDVRRPVLYLAGVNASLVLLAVIYEIFVVLYWSGVAEDPSAIRHLNEYFYDPQVLAYTALIFLALLLFLFGDLLSFGVAGYAPILVYGFAGLFLLVACLFDLPLWIETLQFHWNPQDPELDRLTNEEYQLALFHTALEGLRILYAFAFPVVAAILIRLHRRRAEAAKTR